MGLREIEPGMAIHCRTEEESRALMEWARQCGYEWIDGMPEGYTAFDVWKDCTCYNFFENGRISYADKAYFEKYKKKEVVEFSDLAIPELTAAEVLDAFREICSAHSCIDGRCILYNVCPAYAPFGGRGYSSGAVIDVCREWIAAHGKMRPGKEPQIETVDVCRIIEILPDGGRRCVHEADIGLDAPFGSERLEAEEMLKEYCMGHEGDFIAVHEVVSRVKRDGIKA